MKKTSRSTTPHSAPILFLALALASAFALLAPAAGAAELSFCPPGSEAGQCGRPEGLAVDRTTGHLYVTDRDNRRIDVFDSEGHFLFAFGWKVDKSAPTEELQRCTTATGCQQGAVAPPPGQFARLEGKAVAVDNDPASASFHDVYVFDRSNERVSKFDPEGNLLGSFAYPGEGHCQFSGNRQDPIAVGPGGTIYLADMQEKSGQEFGRVEKFNPSTFACEGEAELGHGPAPWTVGGLALDGSGSLFATVPASGVHKYTWSEPTATLVETIDEGTPTSALATDAAGHLWASQLEAKAHGIGIYPVITEYDAASGKTLVRFGYSQGERGLPGLAPYPGSGGGTFASESDLRVRYLEAPPLPPGPIVALPSVKASGIGNAQATLEAEANPEGKEASYRFEYLTEQAYQEQESSFTGPGTTVGPTVSLGSAKLFNVHYAAETVGCPDPLSEAGHPGETAIEAGECLIPETAYRFRVVVTNADNPEGTGEARAEGTFTTKPPLEVEATFATEAGTDSARLGATVNPLGIPTTGHFELVEGVGL